jgi:hypothetical protein
MDAVASCPACGRRDTLIALGVRWDHPHHWRFWITALMHLYLCEECDALIEVRNATAVRDRAQEPDDRIVASASRPDELDAAVPGQEGGGHSALFQQIAPAWKGGPSTGRRR